MALTCWLICGLVGYIYFGIRTKWIGRRYNTKSDDCVEIVVCTLCGWYTLLIVVLTKY